MFFNLIPHVTGEGTINDGLGIVLSPTFPAEHFERSMTGPHVETAEWLLERGEPDRAMRHVESALREHPDSFDLQAVFAQCLAASGDADAAVSVLSELGRPTDRPGRHNLTLWHTTGKVALEAPDPARLRDGELACEAALEQDPDWTACAITMGIIQFERARYGEALQTLSRAYGAARSTDETARCLAFLALASHGAGFSDDARRFRRALHEFDPSPRLLERVATELPD